MNLNTDGIVIREQNIGEADRLITLLTRDYGVLKAFARGARNIKSKNNSSTQLLCYSRFTIYRGRDSYIIDSAEPVEVFFNLRNDIEKLSLALYLADVSAELSPEEDKAEDFLRLLLNSLYLLCKDKRPMLQIKAVLELRALCLAGYMPDLIACASCFEHESDIMYFSMRSSTLYCQNCNNSNENIPLSIGVVTAMRYIMYSDFEKLFDFTLTDDGFKALSEITEKYLLMQTQRNYKTLDFYHSLNNI